METTVKKTFNIALDVKRPSSNRDFEVVEGDNGNVLVITLTDDGVPVDLTDCNVLAVFSKTDGRTAQQDLDHGISISGDDNNVVTIDLYTTSFAPGMVECELQIISGDNVLITTAKFNFNCRRSIFNEETIPATDEYPILIGLINTCEEIAAAEAERVPIEAARQAAESARMSAESARASAESARMSAESGRVNAENARASAESARASAESARVIAENARAGAESARASAESARVIAENARTGAESTRAINESARQSAETLRASAESARVALYNKWANPDIQITTLSPGSSATASVEIGSSSVAFELGVPKGDTGAAATVEVGTTQTTAPGTDAEVSNSGTSGAAVLDFKIPRGASGVYIGETEPTDPDVNVWIDTSSSDDENPSVLKIKDGDNWVTIPSVARLQVDEITTNTATTINGILKGNGSYVAQAVAGTDYAAASHTHGNITNDGKIGTAANKALFTASGGVVQADTLPIEAGGTGATDADTARGNIGAAAPGLLSSQLTLPTSGYSGSGPYTKTFTVNGASTNSEKRYLLFPHWSSNAATRANEQKAWNLIEHYEISAADTLRITVKSVPATAVNFSLKEVA